MSNAGDFVIENGVLKKYTGPGGDVVIPDGVTSIGSKAFCFCDSLKSIVIPDSVTSIGNYAFWGCRSLTNITLPNSVTSIGDGAFEDCSSLTSITIPNSVTSIGNSAFTSCYGLTNITIPHGVTSIGIDAFLDCGSLTNIVISDSITSIGDRAFKGCNSLADIVIPDSVTSIGTRTFYGCSSLTNITISNGITSIEDEMFIYCWKLSSIMVPSGVTSIGNRAFYCCGSLTNISTPDSVTSIGTEVFYGCSSLTSIVLPDSITSIGDRVFADCRCLQTLTVVNPELRFGKETFGNTVPSKLKDKGNALWPHLTDGEIKRYYLSKTSWEEMDVDMQAQLFLARQGKTLLSSYSWCVSDFESFGNAVLNQFPAHPAAADCKSLANFMLLFAEDASVELLQRMYETLKPLAAAARALKTIQADRILIKCLSADRQKDSESVVRHPAVVLAESYLKNRVFSKEISNRAKLRLPYADGSGTCPQNVLALLLAEYDDQWKQNAEKVRGDMGTVEMLVGAPKVRPSKVADEIAASLDSKALVQFLAGLAYGNFYRSYILAYARFADEVEIERFTNKIEKKKRGHAKERYWAQNAKQALYLSETTAAVRYFERRGGLEYYAEMRGKSVDALRMERLYNFGLNEAGKKVYNLGEKEISVFLNNDLTLTLFDEAAGKIVKSIPKRGAAEEKHAAAVEDLASLKTSIKLARTTQFEQLFKAFLRGTSQKSAAWRNFYAKDPVFGRIASLIVWEQEGRTFTLKDGRPIDSAEQPYTIGDAPIAVAHPMEMQPEEIKAWQKYFAAYSIKQPFAQIWEPIINFSAVRKDRYSGVELPAYRFKGQEKHGIIFLYDYGSGELEIDFTDCSLDLWNKTALGRHEIDLQGTFELGDFKAKKSRASNHIIGLLDKWTVYGRILKDDISITEQLPQFTLAQITDFITLASENNCTNCTAALLEFKNANFSEFDPMAEFTLE